MTVPGRREALQLLLSLDPPPWHLRHSRGVAETAGWVAARIAARGIPVNRPLVESAALLHDIDKLLPPTDPVRALPHGDAGAAWLTRSGYPELARAVANHPVTRLADEARYARWSAFATREERIVAYADKRCGQRLEPMAGRFGEWERRHPPAEDRPEARDDAGRSVRDEGPHAARVPATAWTKATLARVWSRAVRLEADVCRAAGVEPSEVRRLRWTGPVLLKLRGHSFDDRAVG
jgi:putative nucleotidyltransferase with HDIG domain